MRTRLALPSRWGLAVVGLAFLGPTVASAQLTVVSYDGIAETALAPVFNYGPTASGDTRDIRFRARNSGLAAVVLTTLSVTGGGFSFIGPPGMPYTIAPGNFVEFPVRFTAGIPSAYSANLKVNDFSAVLLATAVAAPSLTIVSGCTGPDPATRTIDFSNVQKGSSVLCTFLIKNAFAQALTVNVLAVTGGAFQQTLDVQTPLTIQPGQPVTFTIRFTPADAGSYSGTLVIDTRSFVLSGRGFNGPLPKPLLRFDSTGVGSAEQHTVAMQLPAPSPIAASGSLNLAFAPASPLIADDAAVMFVSTGTRNLPFSIRQGDTQITINGQPSAVFQTGTSAGVLTFTVNAGAIGVVGDPSTRLTVAAGAISIDTASATRGANSLEIVIIGYDNTYTAGSMSFIFYDVNGNLIGPGAIPANFTAAFRTYFTGQLSGSAFFVRITFPVTGGTAGVAGVDVAMSNSLSVSHTQRLNFAQIQ